jgi:predicted transcriptional regulator
MPYFKIDTRIKDWEWHDSPNIMALWVAILYSTNWKEKKWHGITIERGQFITSVKHLSQMTGLSVRQVRYSLHSLEVTGEVAIKTTNRYSLITVNKWEEYQVNENNSGKQNGKQNVAQMADKWQTNGKQMATTEALKHLSIKENTNTKYIRRFVKPSLTEVMEYCQSRNNAIDAQAFLDFYESKGWLIGKTPMKDWKAAIRTWERHDYGKREQPSGHTDMLPDYMLKTDTRNNAEVLRAFGLEGNDGEHKSN